MSLTSDFIRHPGLIGFLRPGPLWFLLSVAAALIYFWPGIEALLEAWQLPEYSHGPLIPVLSLLLFLRQLKTVPIDTGPVVDRWPGVILLLVAMAFGMLGKLSQIDEIVAYSLILWVGAILLISFGWRNGRQFWPPVLHLVYMLPLPGVLYYKLSIFLQFVSSELGVWFLTLINVPVFLDGNIIDLGIFKLQVAEACSGLRYLFPILSFSYIFAVLYKGPMWHKAVVLLAAAPITVVMNSARIAFAGWIVKYKGLEYLEGFTHFFEGWVIFLICIVLLFALAWLMLLLQPNRMSLIDALDLDTTDLLPQALRLRLIQPSVALVLTTVLLSATATAWYMRPAVDRPVINRDPFALFPTRMGDWVAGIPNTLTPDVERVLGADEYLSVDFRQTGPGSEAVPRVDLFIAWYDDQSNGGTHSPEVCLPGNGWEISLLERVDVAPELGLEGTYNLNRAIIQKGEARMLAYYWFEQHGRHVAWDIAAKFYLLWDGFTVGRTDGALVRLITPIGRDETDAQAEARLQQMFLETVDVLPRFVPGL